MFKIIKLANGRYFQGYEENEENGFIKSTSNPLDAKKFIPRERWYEEEELNQVKNELDERVIYKVMMLNYSIEDCVEGF